MKDKPIKPIEPRVQDYPKESPVTKDNEYVKAYHKYIKELAKYEIEMDIWNQTKLIQLVKNASVKYLLKNYRITKIKK